ncbi:hypothetical protein BJ980_002272 [Nocardioides daedukensis]|uniref:DUF2384 domain-containing protein n=1 Tax=Nocardioides daedukensis TaxID=634462 RepID=A0A7Y9S428_9ACTN|nr:hypothetical protein [Nocardioides daedukensis]NYG59349.1 hypothetical protein [Nocardioides daedukensis]
MTANEDHGSPGEPQTTQPVFDVPQPDGTSVTLDFTTPGPFGDFAFTAHIPAADGTVEERVYGAYHTEEAAIFVEILQHWARVSTPDDILAGLDRADRALRILTADVEATTHSQNNFDNYLNTGIEPLAAMNFLPDDHEHSDESGGTIVLAPHGTDLEWISHRDPRTTFTLPPSHLWVFVAGMIWRTYDHDSIPLSRLNTAAYETACATFRRAIRSRSETEHESQEPVTGGDPNDNLMDTPELVRRLCDLLGAKLVAYLVSVTDTRTVRVWAASADGSEPPDEVIERLRIAYQAATLLSEKDAAPVIQAWFQGRNPLLDGVAPARVLRDGEVDVVGPRLMGVARAFGARSSEM